MAKYIISEGVPLKGTIKVDGAKNSVLPIIAATLLGESRSIIEEVPDLNDVKIMCNLLRSLGAVVEPQADKSAIAFHLRNTTNSTAPYELVNKLRASFLVMGPMLAREGFVRVALPGGCPIGSRPVDLHLKGFATLGAEIAQGHGYVEARRTRKLIGNKIYLDFPSVGATENIMMAAVLADGQTSIENAAIEPEIVDLASYLNEMGACVRGAGTDTIRIEGVERLKGCNHAVIPDRIEAGTYMVAAAITHGNVKIDNVVPDHLKPIIAKLKEIGTEIEEDTSSITVKGSGDLKPIDLKTLPYPGFPTDMQAQMTSLLSCTAGTSIVTETIFENRFMHVSELKRMGANIKIEGRTAVIEGKGKLTGASVKATDLRAGAALVLAGLAAEGSTEISEIQHIDRGYCALDKKLQALGAKIERIEEEQY
ncbi:UDP-N-acetylglucosamine 1-carboxyvinyltransferase [Ruminiclostridium sufflavum DSM 19573]|uniref:UDP-N-acetylglucosamine 1-carboxyvinyltransferase n=1 Tax=Ruminiclostridium sufflavum DSM 19573 TaxID=1121337 RepID=A0A318Y252_9FIRM|nr:UDP-N-acetylglucosamine 1-carboxyvinyltransferase [Ruminiclostridium sufflavum]PYG89519.1 UDP-N-acetylglucosamine 1-carboxyvinyltransferase [Ruminiclostridium sufflavum DSM 19573]